MRALSTKSGTPSAAAARITASTTAVGLGERLHLVLDVGARPRPARSRGARSRPASPYPRLEVGGHRQVDRVDDPAHGLEHQVDAGCARRPRSRTSPRSRGSRWRARSCPRSAATTRALATSQTLTRVSRVGSVWRASSAVARSAVEVMVRVCRRSRALVGQGGGTRCAPNGRPFPGRISSCTSTPARAHSSQNTRSTTARARRVVRR